MHRAHALQFKALGLIRILPAYCHVSSQLPSDALELALELVGSTILHNSQEEHLHKEKVEPSIRKEKKLTEFASNTCSAIQGSRPHQNTTSLLPCVASTFHQMRWNLRWNLWGLPSCNSRVKHLHKEKVEPSIRKEKKLTEFASSTCTAIQGSRPHQKTTSLLPCVESTSIRYVGSCRKRGMDLHGSSISRKQH